MYSTGIKTQFLVALTFGVTRENTTIPENDVYDTVFHAEKESETRFEQKLKFMKIQYAKFFKFAYFLRVSFRILSSFRQFISDSNFVH